MRKMMICGTVALCMLFAIGMVNAGSRISNPYDRSTWFPNNLKSTKVQSTVLKGDRAQSIKTNARPISSKVMWPSAPAKTKKVSLPNTWQTFKQILKGVSLLFTKPPKKGKK